MIFLLAFVDATVQQVIIMLKQTSHILIIILLAILLPSALSFPYSIYGMKNYRRASRASNNQLPIPSATRQRYDQQGYRSPSSQQAASASTYYGNYDSLYDTGTDNYYVDDEPEDRPEREYLYGRPTYHGEYKPTRYYYARAPSYNNYYNDHSEPTNPLDDLHEEMLQEEQHDRQRNWPSGKPNWFQNTGQPKSLTSNFMKNLMLYNNGVNVDQPLSQPQPMDMDNVYGDEDDVNSPYGASGDISNQNEPYDYFDPMKIQSTHQFNRFDSSPVNKQTYFNQDNRNENNDYYTLPNKNHKQNDYDMNDEESHEDKEEKDLESLRKNQKNQNPWDRNDGEKQQSINDASANKHSENNAYNGGFDTGFDYDEDEWINWDRKRSLPKKQNENLRPLKVLEYQLTRALHEQVDTSSISTTTTTVVPPTTSTTR